MPESDEIFDSPTKWVAQHIRRYVETDGHSGHMWHGVSTLLLTTQGRKSGILRRTALIYGTDGDRYVVVASRGGHAKHPAWYLNLVANPSVQVQLRERKFSAQAYTAQAAERTRLWAFMVSLWSTYATYQAKTDREIPVVVLAP